MAGNIQVSSRIELDQAILSRLDEAAYDALAETADATLTELRDRQVMPFDTGNMQNDSTSVDDSQRDKVSIATTAPQARRLYFHPEYNFRRNNNRKAGGHWFDSLLNDTFILEAFCKLLKQKGGL